jgi:hypothetical protein
MAQSQSHHQALSAKVSPQHAPVHLLHYTSLAYIVLIAPARHAAIRAAFIAKTVSDISIPLLTRDVEEANFTLGSPSFSILPRAC